MQETFDQSALYKSAAGYAAVMAWYDAALKRLPGVHTSGFVSTRHGDTHVIAAGRLDAPPLVLVHPLSANALMWSRELPLLARDFRVIAPDIIGMAGRSAPTRLSYKRMGYAEWLADVLDAFQIERARMIGMAFGGWLVLKFGALHPQRLARAALLGSAGFMPVRWRYILPLIPDIVFLSDEKARRLSRTLLAPDGFALDESAVEFLYLVLRHFKSQSEAPAINDTALRRVSAPTLLLMGDHEDVWNPQAVIARAHKRLPNVQAEIVSDAAHALTMNQPDVVMNRVLKFLTDG